MPWYGWALVGLMALGSVLTITKVEQPRKPTTSGEAAWMVMINAACIVAILALGGVIH